MEPSKIDATAAAGIPAAACTPSEPGAPAPETPTATPAAAPTHAAEAAAAATPARLMSLSDVVLNLALGYLDSDSLAVCQSCCRDLGSAAQSDDLWQAKCLKDWGEKRKVCPHQRSPLVLVATYLAAWRAWRRAFNGYCASWLGSDSMVVEMVLEMVLELAGLRKAQRGGGFCNSKASDVKRVGIWWAGVEAWMSEHLPEVVGTLNIGVAEEDLDRAEEMLGWPLPVHLRLLYRFHNGQWLPWDERLTALVGVDEGRPPVLPQVAGNGISLGLLGGYCFYHYGVTSKLFSLQRGVVAGLATAEALLGENKPYFEASANRWGTDVATLRSRGGFLLAAAHDMNKKAWVGKDGNVRFDGKHASLMGSFDAAPVTAPPVAPSSHTHASTHGSSSAGGGGAAGGGAAGGGGGGGGGAGAAAGAGDRRYNGGNLMIWLEEYLSRLDSGHYGVKARWRERIRPAGGGVPRMHKLRGVWLFPREGGEGCVSGVTKGVEIQASPVFVPEECSDRTDLMWTYTVRMRLLEDHPSRPPAMSSCQLSTRHWEIDGPGGFHREVSGDGVIGEYPLLSVAAPAPAAGNAPEDTDPCVFEYESCTALESTPGTMGGHFSFTPGSLDSPKGPAFNARVPTFDLKDPTFIF